MGTYPFPHQISACQLPGGYLVQVPYRPHEGTQGPPEQVLARHGVKLLAAPSHVIVAVKSLVVRSSPGSGPSVRSVTVSRQACSSGKRFEKTGFRDHLTRRSSRCASSARSASGAVLRGRHLPSSAPPRPCREAVSASSFCATVVLLPSAPPPMIRCPRRRCRSGSVRSVGRKSFLAIKPIIPSIATGNGSPRCISQDVRLTRSRFSPSSRSRRTRDD